MAEWLLKKYGTHYIPVMMVLTRVFCCVGGGLVIYYINLNLNLPPSTYERFIHAAAVVIIFASLMTVWLALWETPCLRKVLAQINRGETFIVQMGRRAGREAVTFSGKHHFREAIMVPTLTVLPLWIYMAWFDHTNINMLAKIGIAGFLGISAVLMINFFVSEWWMAPVIRLLLDKGAEIKFNELTRSRLSVRMNVCFTLAISVTALMIGALANQRAMDIIRNPDRQTAAVANLRRHTVYISLTAVGVGIVLSRLLANSVAARAGYLVTAMKRVENGDLSQRMQPTGTDEIDILARQFNAMVGQLDQNDQTIRDLNANLEQKVKRRTRQLSRSKRSLQRSLRKLQEYDQLKTEFFSNISHELRTPLTMILSPIERILEGEDHDLPPRVSSLLKVMQINGERLLKLINQLLEFSKLEAGRTQLKRTALDLNRLVRDLVKGAKPLAEQRGVRLDVQLDPAVPVIGADEEKIDTVLGNLLSNALKFTSEEGEVHVQTQLSDSQVCVSVQDTGIGIAESDYQRIFERFVQIDGSLSREFSGTGLGLSLAKELIELHEGEISVESRLGEGTCFRFTLPLSPVPETLSEPNDSKKTSKESILFADLVDCPAEVSTSDPPNSPTTPDAPRVLVVDDTPEVRSLLKDILCEDYQILSATDGVEGLEVAEREIPDLIISDVMMPQMDGYEFCRRIKENPATIQIPFVMLTAKAELAMKIEGLNCGVDDYLSKPFHAEELQARVHSLLNLRRLHKELDQRNSELETTLQELRSTQNQLLHSEKMSSLGQLAAGLAHEINNSINAVYNGIQPLHKKTKNLEQLIVSTWDSPKENAESQNRNEIETAFRKISTLAEVIENGASRTARIVGDLKTFSHPGSETSESFDLHRALDVCLNLLSNQFKHRITVHKDYGDIGWVYGPPGQLNQVFMNLLSNAEQAISEKGEITISTCQENNWVKVRIRDNGKGIPEKIRKQIFDPFFTTKGPGVGTGLGLSLSYGIVTKLGGMIECQSQEEKGTEFIVSLPQVANEEGDSPNATPHLVEAESFRS